MLRSNEWWAVIHRHSGVPCCTDGQAALFETLLAAQTYKRRLFQHSGVSNTRILKMQVVPS